MTRYRVIEYTEMMADKFTDVTKETGINSTAISYGLGLRLQILILMAILIYTSAMIFTKTIICTSTKKTAHLKKNRTTA